MLTGLQKSNTPFIASWSIAILSLSSACCRTGVFFLLHLQILSHWACIATLPSCLHTLVSPFSCSSDTYGTYTSLFLFSMRHSCYRKLLSTIKHAQGTKPALFPSPILMTYPKTLACIPQINALAQHGTPRGTYFHYQLLLLCLKSGWIASGITSQLLSQITRIPTSPYFGTIITFSSQAELRRFLQVSVTNSLSVTALPFY